MRALLSLTVLIAALAASGGADATQGRATLTVDPPSGPYGTEFRAKATGLLPGTAVIAVMRFPTGEEAVGPFLDAVPPSGEWDVPEPWLSAAPEPLGQYVSQIKTADGATVLASATFTVTDP